MSSRFSANGLHQSGLICPLGREKLASQRRIRTRWRVVKRQIEDLLELDDVVDLGTHRDVGNSFEYELDHHRNAVFRHQLARRRESRLRVLRVGDADGLAAEAFGYRNVIDAIDAKFGRVDVLERQLYVIIHVETALRLADQSEV